MRTDREILEEVISILTNGLPREGGSPEDAVKLAHAAVRNAPRRAERWTRMTEALKAYALRQEKLIRAVRQDVAEHKNQGVFEDYMLTKHFPRMSAEIRAIAKSQIEREARNADAKAKSR